MKKSITGAVALLAGAVVAHSQGTVSFANYFAGGNYVTVELNGTAIGGTGTHSGIAANDGTVGSDWTVELYGLANTTPGVAQPLSALVPAILDGTASTPVTATLAGGGTGPYLGQWNSTAIGDISGSTLSGQSVTVAVAAWYNNGGTINSITAAQAANMPNAFSATGVVNTGGPAASGPPATAPGLPQLGNGVMNLTTTTPEPSTIALGVMGASAFLMRLRKKQ